jgi:hypothetical protein
MHLHSTTLERYLDGSLDERTRTALDSHVANCLPCAESLAEACGRDIAWVRRGVLRRLVRVHLD